MDLLRLIAIAGIAAGVLVAGSGPARAQLLSPGHLAAAHADLDGDSDCGQCHSQGRRVEADKCLRCHTELAARVRAGAGLHGRAYRGQPCERCHVDHLGRNSRLVRWPGGAMENLDHADTGWKLAGGHAKVACAKCHTRTTRGGRATFLGAATACSACHKDPHAGRFGTGCNSCHSEGDWKEVRLERFDHAKTRFALRGKHALVHCEKCHGTPPRWQGIESATCSACHPDPHGGRFEKPCESCHGEEGWAAAGDAFRRKHPGLSLGGGHAGVDCKKCHDRGNDRAPSRGSECVSCHPAVHEAPFGRQCGTCHRSIRWLGLPREIGLDAHGKTAYPLDGAHRDVDCGRCHPTAKPLAARYRALRFDRCAACHADRHAGELVRFDGGECATCHTTAAFMPTSFGLAAHAGTAFPLEGRHQAAPCGACHRGDRPRLDLRVSAKACADCHANPHGDQFASEMAQGGCAHCHSAADWEQPKIDHSIWPLTGAHTTAACAACHGAAAGAGAVKPADYRGVPRACDGCHEDVHAAQFRLSEPVRACDTCHDTGAFALPGFDHRARAGYPLDGKHAKVPCAGCHPQQELRNGVKAIRWRLGYRRCRDCHANPHREAR